LIPRLGEIPNTKQRYKLRPGAYVILPREGQVLLTYQHGINPELQLPGGGIDHAETPLQGLYREVREETGWTISKPVKLGCFRRFVFMPEYDLWAEKLCTIYKAHPARPISKPLEDDHETVWVTPKTAAEKLDNAGDRLFIRRLFGL